jgi:predicted RND superfamily exporter protein
MATTGRAILVTSIVLCIGFAGNLLATMQNLISMGILTCFAITAAFLADVLLAPALLTLLLRRPSAAKPAARAGADARH